MSVERRRKRQNARGKEHLQFNWFSIVQGRISLIGIATDWLQEHSSELRNFRWPPKPPDRNIIEYIWDILQRAVQKRSSPPFTPIDLWTPLQDSWCQLPPALLQTLIESMPRRVAALLRARGRAGYKILGR
ncbi:transposable element tcb2 transposase [Trichonephila clavata]|uniref:Transposable element tcb2 transposase n=1 Tax=Trichonephila clavata TaxID=2740835 RepID=A0A8X6L9H3_TRICU|nr:transposable element tcb2 transposase [Trichonephila clavata]